MHGTLRAFPGMYAVDVEGLVEEMVDAFRSVLIVLPRGPSDDENYSRFIEQTRTCSYSPPFSAPKPPPPFENMKVPASHISIIHFVSLIFAIYRPTRTKYTCDFLHDVVLRKYKLKGISIAERCNLYCSVRLLSWYVDSQSICHLSFLTRIVTKWLRLGSRNLL